MKKLKGSETPIRAAAVRGCEKIAGRADPQRIRIFYTFSGSGPEAVDQTL